MQNIGFIGTGIMGAAMVRNLMQAGFSVTVNTRTKEKADALLAEGAYWANSIAACVKDKDAVITIVGYPQDVEQVYFGKAGILENADKNSLLIDMTTSRPQLAERIYTAAGEYGLFALDAPVTGGEPKAVAGALTIMAGGDKAAFDRAMPLFSAMGENIRYLGKAGNGQHCKMANQIGIAGALSGVCEALAYANAVGLNAQQTFDTIKTGSAQSTQMELMGSKIITHDDSPSFYLKHIRKDLQIAMDELEARQSELPMAKFVCNAYAELEQQGFGDCGSQSLYRFYER